MSVELEILREVNRKITDIQKSRKPVWELQKNVPVLAGRSDKEMQTFRDNNPGLWKNMGTDARPRYVYDRTTIQ